MLLPLLAQAYADGGAPPPDARFAFALYCNPTCDGEVMDALDDGLRAIRSREGFAERVVTPQRIMGLSGPDFGIPDADYSATFGVEVGDPAALAGSQEVLLAWVAGPREEARATLAVAHAAFATAARLAGGWVEDLDTGTVYGASAWAALDPRGPLTDWFVVDADPTSDADGAPLRVVSRGLRRFGLPELVVEDVPEEAAGDVAFVVNAVAETLDATAGGGIAEAVAVDTVNVQGMASLSAVEPGADDPAPPLLRLRFEGSIAVGGEEPPLEEPPVDAIPAVPVAEAAPVAAPLAVPVAEAPTPPARVDVPRDPAPPPPQSLGEARAQASARLDGVVRSAWEAGLAEGEVVAVSAPFRTRTGSTEYLWVELRQWSGTNMSGVLVNEPYAVPNLHKGDVVAVRQADVFDYIWKKRDGSREGNGTAPFVTR